ncbi:MAG: Fic family protein [Raoultibacter sp.]
MTAQEMENIIAEVEHSLAVEHMAMTSEEKENLRRVGRGELSFQELIAQYVDVAKRWLHRMPKQGEQDYDYRYDPNDPYVYEGTHVLINKFGLTDCNEVSHVERMVTGAAVAFLENSPIQGKFDLAHLQAIHETLFEEIYDWAGQIRKQGFISKGNSLFCKAEFIKPYAANLFGQLQREQLLTDLEHDVFAERISYYISEINALHPFREGNGRTQRVFVNHLSRQAGWNLNFASTKPDTLCEACITSMKDCSALTKLLKGTISPL